MRGKVKPFMFTPPFEQGPLAGFFVMLDYYDAERATLWFGEGRGPGYYARKGTKAAGPCATVAEASKAIRWRS